MTHHTSSPNKLMTLKEVEDLSGRRKSTIYERIAGGLFPRQVIIGTRSARWLHSEVEAINLMHVGGASEEQLKVKVIELHNLRPQLDRQPERRHRVQLIEHADESGQGPSVGDQRRVKRVQLLR